MIRQRASAPRQKRTQNSPAHGHCPGAVPASFASKLCAASPAALQDFSPLYLRYGSAADIIRHLVDVRFIPQSGQNADTAPSPALRQQCYPAAGH